MWVLSLLVVLFAVGVQGEEIKDLPGLSFKINFKHYSGYFKVSPTHFLHYWFVESQSDPTTDPVTFWFNGGPRCSSMEGLLNEMGPYVVNDDGETLRENPDAWNKFANVLYLESPAGVGYSYASDGNTSTSDDQTAAENYEAVKQFYREFPNFRNNSFYIFGESYGGIYVPTLSALIIDGQKDFPVNFKGIGIGNGLLNYEAFGYPSLLPFFYAHGFSSELNYKTFETECCSGCADTCDFSNLNETCEYLAETLSTGWGVFAYDIYRQCDESSVDGSRIVEYRKDKNHVRFDDVRDFEESKKTRGFPSCLNDEALTKYMNMTTVREALYIPQDLDQWQMCGGFPYKETYSDVTPEILKIVDAKVPILFYYGDTDSVCNFLGAQHYLADLGLKLLEDKKPWNVADEIGGFVTVYEGFTFITVRGAGHMVCFFIRKTMLQAPQWRAPEVAYAVKQFLSKQPI